MKTKQLPPKRIKVQVMLGNGRTAWRWVDLYTSAQALKAAQAGFHVRRVDWLTGTTITKDEAGNLRYHSGGKPLQGAVPEDFRGDDWEVEE